MPNLSALLHLGNNAAQAHKTALATVGKNIANAQTEGYRRQVVDLESTSGPLGGVRAKLPQRIDDPLLSRRERRARGDWGAAAAMAKAMEVLERAVGGATGSDLVSGISRFQASLVRLSAAPLDTALRGEVVASAQDVSRLFRRTAQDIASARADADDQIALLAQEATGLAAEIADLNRKMSFDKDPVLADRRDQLAQKLATLMGGAAHIDNQGHMRITVANGVVLVDGTRAAQVQAAPAVGMPDTFRRVALVDGTRVVDITSQLAQGEIGGMLKMRDDMGAQAARDLDALAVTLANAVNAIHTTGVGLDGVSGRPMFVAETSGTVTSAANMALLPSLAQDSRQLATRSAPAPAGDNQALLALVQIFSQPLAAGGTRTFADEALRFIGAVGQAKVGAEQTLEVEDARAQALASLRESLSGVSLEEEMTELMALRQASQAATTFIATIDNIMQNMLERL